MFHSEIQKSTATFPSLPTLKSKTLIFCSHLLCKTRNWHTVNSELNIKYEIFYLSEPALHSRFSITVRNTNRTTHLHSQDTLQDMNPFLQDVGRVCCQEVGSLFCHKLEGKWVRKYIAAHLKIFSLVAEFLYPIKIFWSFRRDFFWG